VVGDGCFCTRESRLPVALFSSCYETFYE